MNRPTRRLIARNAIIARQALKQDGYRLTDGEYLRPPTPPYTRESASLWHATILPPEDFSEPLEECGNSGWELTAMLNHCEGVTVIVNFYRQPELRIEQ